MRIIVCIKQVPGTTEVKVNPETNTLIREGVEAIINPFDVYAIEEGVRLKERFGGTVTVITMGPPQAADALREAISLGADDAALISDRAFAGSDTLATSYTLSCAIRKLGDYDLIICGKQAADGDTAQVGPGIAEWLNIPFVAFVGKIDEVAEGRMFVERLMDDGHEVLTCPLPALISVVKEINEPRMPSLKGKMRAKSSQIPTWGAKDLAAEAELIGFTGSPTKVHKIFVPQHHKAGEVWHGEPADLAAKLVHSLKAEGVV